MIKTVSFSRSGHEFSTLVTIVSKIAEEYFGATKGRMSVISANFSHNVAVVDGMEFHYVALVYTLKVFDK